MMSAAEYSKHKTIFKKGHKNPISEDIHTLLLAYEGAQTPNRRIKLLVLLYLQTVGFQLQYENKLAGESYKGGLQRQAAGPAGTRLKGAYGVETIAPQKKLVENYGLNTRIPAFGMSLLTQIEEFEIPVFGLSIMDKATNLTVPALRFIRNMKTGIRVAYVRCGPGTSTTPFPLNKR
jgi:hypothetical protein